MYVEEWLDSLPYVDFKNVTTLLHEALEAANQMDMKPAQRLELIGLYNRPYQYYIDTQVKAGANHTLQSIEMVQAQIGDMKQMALELSTAGRRVMDESLSHKSLWGQNKFPLEAAASSMRYLSHAMIFSFLEYAPVTQGLWKEINFLYQMTEKVNQQRKTVNLIGTGKKSESVTLEKLYTKALLTYLADPYHMPFGAIWEIYQQLKDWRGLCELKTFATPEKADNYFVVNLTSDNGPLAYEKFNKAKASANHRILSTSKLVSAINTLLKDLDADKDISDKVNISSYYREHILTVLSRAWGNPPKRSSARKSKSGQLNMAHGLPSIFYYLNDEHEFNMSNNSSDEATDVAAFNVDKTSPADYQKVNWQLADASSGGVAVTRPERPGEILRVGDLIGMSLDEKNLPKETFRVGILRWLLVKQNKLYRAGIEIINKQIYPAGLRSKSGSMAEKEYRRCLITGNPAKTRTLVIFTSKGLFIPDRLLEINYRNKQYQGKITGMVNSTTCFDQFNFQLQ